MNSVVTGESVLVSESQVLAHLVQRWSRYTDLSRDDRGAILSLPFTRRSFGKDAYMIREGERATECSLMLRGFSFRQKLLRNGSRQIISFHIPSEFIDLQNGVLGTADHNVQSLDACEVAVIPRAALLEIAEKRSAVRLAMWTDTLIDASIFREWVVNVGRRSSRARIAHLLCEFAFRLDKVGTGSGARFDFPLTQEQLADANRPHCGSHQPHSPVVAQRWPH